jgi:hypothetical protein
MRVWLRSSPTRLACSWHGTRNRPSTPATPPPAVGPGARRADRAAAVLRSSRSDRSKIAARDRSTIDGVGRLRIAIAGRLRTVGRSRIGRRFRTGRPIRIGHPAISTIAMHRPAAARATTIATSSRGVDHRAGRRDLIQARAVVVGHPAEAAVSARGGHHLGVVSESAQRRWRAREHGRHGEHDDPQDQLGPDAARQGTQLAQLGVPRVKLQPAPPGVEPSQGQHRSK